MSYRRWRLSADHRSWIDPGIIHTLQTNGVHRLAVLEVEKQLLAGKPSLDLVNVKHRVIGSQSRLVTGEINSAAFEKRRKLEAIPSGNRVA